ncbi:metal ABC transporter ATP-binding protein, partial [Arthrobacter sp. H41]|uniref:metal ABC transporter ATP-binding protein n=1 Tax=Arthrobacter sp. H41 TaxID=1312978 RepID=UPI000676718A
MTLLKTQRQESALDIARLTVSYTNRPVLWDVDAWFPTGALSAITGPNGAGKSTLLRAALGLLPVDAGHASIGGRPARKALDQVAYVPQREGVDWDFPITVREVVEMGRYRSTGWFRRITRSDKSMVDACLERVGMSEYSRRQIGQLSGGQRQRIFLARALAQNTQLLVMDEPFAGIDARTEADLLGLLGELRDEGRTIIIVHHDLDTIREVFDWALLLNVRTIACGPAKETLSAQNLLAAYGAGPSRTRTATAAAGA